MDRLIKAGFVRGKYLRWYGQLIDRARARVLTSYFERHHVIPRALGGEHGEVVSLTYREHFLAHWLLVKITRGKARHSMQCALSRMGGMTMGRDKARVFIGAWRHAIARKAHVDARRSRVVKQDTKDKIRAALMGRTITPEWREKLRASRLGKPLSDETKAKLRAANIGKKHSEETRKKNSLAHIGKTKSAETRRRMSEGKRGFVFSEESREKMSASQKRRFALERAEASQ